MVRKRTNNNDDENRKLVKSDNKKGIIKTIIKNDVKIIAKNESQVKLINSIKNNEITICDGLAGSGKTYVTLGLALNLLKRENSPYERIYLVKSVTTLKNEEVGFIKGTLKEKMEPFMWSFVINLEKLINEESVKELFNREIIREVPLAYIRGTSLDNCIIVTDESQNISIDNMRTLMTRIGSNCKLIILGDKNQIDLKDKNLSSLSTIIENFSDIQSIGCVVMSEDDDNVRNPLIKTIEDRFKRIVNKKKIKQILNES